MTDDLRAHDLRAMDLRTAARWARKDEWDRIRNGGQYAMRKVDSEWLAFHEGIAVGGGPTMDDALDAAIAHSESVA